MHSPAVRAVDIELMSNSSVIEAKDMSVMVCLSIVSTPGPFETPVTIPLEVEDFVPKYGYRKRRNAQSRSRRSIPNTKAFPPAGK